MDGGDGRVGGAPVGERARGTRRRPGRTRRTTESRGNGSSVSRTHSARSGNRERRLYRGLCSAISRSSRTAASRSCAQGIASTRWDSATISVIRLRCSPAEK